MYIVQQEKNCKNAAKCQEAEKEDHSYQKGMNKSISKMLRFSKKCYFNLCLASCINTNFLCSFLFSKKDCHNFFLTLYI